MTAAPGQADNRDASILHLVKQVQYKAYLRLEEVFRPLGITAVQFRILTTLSALPATSSAELARLYDVKPQTMIKQVAMLETKKLIERATAEDNRRRLELRLTPAGEKVLRECRESSLAVERQILDPLGADEQRLLSGLLARLLLAMDGAPDDGAEEFSPEGSRPGVQR